MEDSSIAGEFPFMARIVLLLLPTCLLLALGCGFGKVGQVIRGVESLEPDVEQRDRQVKELTDPAGGANPDSLAK
jgi:hypothetical protein